MDFPTITERVVNGDNIMIVSFHIIEDDIVCFIKRSPWSKMQNREPDKDSNVEHMKCQ